MSDRVDLLSLAERVEALSGPCRETDTLIANATMERLGFDHSYAAVREEWWQGKGDKRHYQPPAYTASVDSAMSLADPSWWIRVGGPLTEAAYGYSREDQRQITAGFEMIGAPYSVGARSVGTDPIGQIARALTAASLRALAQPTVPQP